MKIVNVIKADFFINPENYGYYACDDLEAIWLECIKPNIEIIEPGCSNIENVYIHKAIADYRKQIMECI